jgi:ADP-glucose pyrophosphorylase
MTDYNALQWIYVVADHIAQHQSLFARQAFDKFLVEGITMLYNLDIDTRFVQTNCETNGFRTITAATEKRCIPNHAWKRFHQMYQR